MAHIFNKRHNIAQLSLYIQFYFICLVTLLKMFLHFPEIAFGDGLKICR